ncbi:MAG: putative transcriptional regulator [candidate division TM6 bacterium GW2011_GWE2_42_60]|nr:MAG: putative transcriptional regulator [candidate division TM6 bacterium GW2011_GWE2_42_60]HBY05322.1 transcriptional regulator [Candidatus Dependentiae bacterium]
MNKKLSFKAFKEEALKDESVRAEYERLTPEFEVIKQFVSARKKVHLSQVELAKRLKVSQPLIARLETGGYAATSVSKLSEVANALGYSLKISLQAKKRN